LILNRAKSPVFCFLDFMRVLFLFTTLLMAGLGAIHAQPEIIERLQVINGHGAVIYSAPSFNAPILGLAKPGSSIEVTGRKSTDQARKIGEDWSLEGDFIEFLNGFQYGYVFSSDLSSKPVVSHKIYEEVTIPTLLGKVLDKKKVTRTRESGGESYEVIDEITTYEFGTYTVTYFDGCFDRLYELKGLTLNEVYHQLRNSNFIIGGPKGERQLDFPIFSKKEANRYHFDEFGAAEELMITQNDDGSYTISYYDCT